MLIERKEENGWIRRGVYFTKVFFSTLVSEKEYPVGIFVRSATVGIFKCQLYLRSRCQVIQQPVFQSSLSFFKETNKAAVQCFD